MGLFLKLFFKMMMPVFLLMGIGTYLLYIQGKDPFQAFRSNTPDSAPSLTTQALTKVQGLGQKVSQATQSKTPPQTRAIYRWVSASGTTTFGTSPPPNAKNLVKVQTIKSKPATATPAAPVAPTQPTQAAVAPPKPKEATSSAAIASPELKIDSLTDVYNPENIKQMLQQAKDIQNVMQQRQQLQQQLLNQ